jgi:iron complex outermembrane receptor protein
VTRPSLCTLTLFLLPFIVTVARVSAAQGPAPAAPPTQTSDPPKESPPRIVEPPVDVVGTAPTLHLDETSSTASRLGVPVRDLPVSVDVVDQRAVQARGARTVVEAAQGTTGLVGVTRAGAAGVFSWRGFTENGIATLFDGIRVQGSTITTRAYDAFAFDRIEVVRGAASGLFGEGALAGAINYVHKSPPSQDRQTVDLLTSVGTQDAARIGAGTGGGLWRGAAYRVDAVFDRFDTSIDGNTNRFGHFVGSLRTNVGRDLVVTLDTDLLRNRTDDAYWGTPLVDGRLDERLARVSYNNAHDNRYRDDVTWLRLGAVWKPTGRIEVSNQLYRYSAARDWTNIGRFLYNAETATVGRTFWEDLAYDHVFYGDRLTARLVTGGAIKNQLLAGVEVSRTDFASPRNYSVPFGLQQQVDPFDPPPVDFFTFGQPRVRARETTLSQWTTFLEDHLQLTPSLSVHGTFRYDSIDADFARFDQTPAQFYRASYGPTTGSVGATYRIGSSTNVYASFGTSSTPADSLLVLGDPTTAAYELTRGRATEAGVKQIAFKGRAQWTAAVYRLEQRDIPSADPDNPSRAIQIGRQRSTGVELSALVTPHPRVTAQANVAVLDAEYLEFREGALDRSGNRPPNVPERVANVFVDYRATERLTFGAWWRGVGDFAGNTSNAIVLPSYSLVDLKGTFAVTSRTDLTLFVKNVTDELYAVWATGAGGQNAMATVGEPRTVELVWRLRF